MTDLELSLTVAGLFLGAISLLFSIFTAGIAFVAIIEWRSYKDFQKKKKETLLKGEQAFSQLIKEKENLQKQTSDIISKIDKTGGKQISDKELKRISELESKIDKLIENTQNNLSTIAASSPFTLYNSATPLIGNLQTSFLDTNSLIGFSHPCSRCGKYYAKKLTELDAGLCDDCKRFS